MRTLTVSLFTFLLSFALAAQAQEVGLPEDVIANIQARVASGENEGVFIGVAGPDGTRTHGFGRLSADRPTAPDSTTVFEIGSVTKVFTALLLAEMAGRGEVALDDPIADYLPDTLAVAFGERVTLEHLAAHTSGLPRLPDNLPIADPSNPYAAYSAGDLYRFLERHELQREPGAAYEYSNLGPALLGHLLARHAGKPYELLLRERVLGPLGLDDTAITLTDDQRARLATGHSGGRAVPGWDFQVIAPAGALRSTGADMLRFLRANLGLIETPLADELAQARAVRAPAYGDSMAVALGWHTRSGPDAEVVWHNGGTGGYRSFVGFDPAAQRGVVVLTNEDLGMDDVGFHLLDASFPLQAVRETVEVAPDVLERYAGQYQFAPSFVITVTRDDDRLYAQATGQPAFRLYPASETEFFVRVVDARLTFHVGADGAVEGLTLHQNGRDQFGARIL